MRVLSMHQDGIGISRMHTMPGRRNTVTRRGAAAVEFAVVAPVLILVLLGVIEVSRAMMVDELLNNAARSGCRAGTIAGSTNTKVTTVVNQCLENIPDSTTIITVNGAGGDVRTAGRGDIVSVEVAVPYSSVSWLPKNRFLGNATLRGTVVMFHE
jgi:Flp pilus assembly protein TadG